MSRLTVSLEERFEVLKSLNRNGGLLRFVLMEEFWNLGKLLKRTDFC